MKYLAILMALLSGCAVCNRHPVACSVGAAIIVSGAVAAYSGHRIQQSIDTATQQQAQMIPGAYK